MIAALDTSEDIAVCSSEINAPVERLLSPLTRFRLEPQGMFCVDNGGFRWADVPGLLSLLKREEYEKHRCRFVAVPDVVCSAIRTLELFEHFDAERTFASWPLALVMQNGMENHRVPWRSIKAIFIGGDDVWKQSPHAVALMKAAKALGKWIHVGRVNTPERWKWALENGADSVDGTGIARYSHMRKAIAEGTSQASLNLEGA